MSLLGDPEQPSNRNSVIKQEQTDDNSGHPLCSDTTFETLYLPGGSGLHSNQQTLRVEENGLLQTKIKIEDESLVMPELEISRVTKVPPSLQDPQKIANLNVAANIWPLLRQQNEESREPSTGVTLKRANSSEATQSVNKVQCLRKDIECLEKDVENLHEEESSQSAKCVLLSVNQQLKNLVKAVDSVSSDVRRTFETNQILMAELKKLREKQERHTDLMEKLLTMLPAVNTGHIEVDPLESAVEINADPVSSSSLMPQTLPCQPFSHVVHYGDSLPLTSTELVSAVDTANGRPSTLLLNLLRAIFPPDELLSCTLTTACPQKKWMVREIKELTSVTKFHALFNNALQANRKTQNYVRKSRKSVNCECCRDQEMSHDVLDSSHSSSSCHNHDASSKSTAPSDSPKKVKCDNFNNM
ncbi:hypothetical protein B566_EDAN012209 [Ephemera danica]|nr:hypothetical protein B566_EDAN012209 [Ephemera danica]